MKPSQRQIVREAVTAMGSHVDVVNGLVLKAFDDIKKLGDITQVYLESKANEGFEGAELHRVVKRWKKTVMYRNKKRLRQLYREMVVDQEYLLDESMTEELVLSDTDGGEVADDEHTPGETTTDQPKPDGGLDAGISGVENLHTQEIQESSSRVIGTITTITVD